MDVEWDEPEFGAFFRMWASFCRNIRYDRRGTGASDPVSVDALPPWESSVEEMLAVMDAAGSQRAAVFGEVDAGPPAMLAAATRPDRVLGLILYQTSARYVAADDYPIGLPQEIADALVAGDRGGMGHRAGHDARGRGPTVTEEREVRRHVTRWFTVSTDRGTVGTEPTPTR